MGRNISYNLIGSLLPLLLALVTIPIYIHVIGPDRYGALAIAWLFLGYFGLFDFGLGRATTQRIAAMKDRTTQDRADVFWTALVINLITGTVGSIILFFLTRFFFGELFKIDEVLRQEMLQALPFLALSVPIATITGVLSGALAGRERFLDVNIGNVVSNIFFTLLPLATAWLISPRMEWLVIASVLGRVLGLGAFGFGVWQSIARGCAIRFDKMQWRALAAFGGWVGISSLVGPMMTMLDRFIIGSTLGARAVTAYTVPFQLASRFLIFPTAIINTLFPRLSSETDVANARGQSIAASISIALMFFAPIVTAICLMRTFFDLWLGKILDDQSILVGQIALMGYWLNGIAGVPFAFVQARGNSKFTALLHVGELIPYLCMLVLFGKFFGLAGVCTAFTVRCGIDLVVLDRKAHRPDYRVLLELIVPTIVIITSIWISSRVHDALASASIASIFGVGALLWSFLRMPEVVRQRLFAKLRSASRF